MVRGGRRPPPSALYWRAAASEASYFQALAHSFALFARSELLIALFSIACALFTKKHPGVPSAWAGLATNRRIFRHQALEWRKTFMTTRLHIDKVPRPFRG